MMHPLLEQFRDFAQKEGIATGAYIVGGAVRDILLGRELKDIDIALPGDALKIAERFAREAGGTFVLLDEHFGIARVVKDGEFLDISSLRNGSILTDLSARDITINAIAVPLIPSHPPGGEPTLIDPYSGKKDLSLGIIRMVSEKNLSEDPLRILRVYRFSAALNSSIEADTLDAVRRHKALLQPVAGERIADELRRLLVLRHSCATVRVMSDEGILRSLFPGISLREGAHALSAYEKAEEVLDHLPAYFEKYAGPVSDYFALSYRKVCLKLSAFLDDPDPAERVASRLKMSAKETVFLRKLTGNRRAVPDLYGSVRPVREAALDLLKKFRDDIYPMLVSAIAELSGPPSGDRIGQFCKEILAFYHDELKPRMELLPVISGNDLIREFHLAPSPRFKEILNAVEDMVLWGKVHTREEALDAVREILKKESS